MSKLGIVTCPKCKMRVLPKTDESCPNCRAAISVKGHAIKRKTGRPKLVTQLTASTTQATIQISIDDWQKLIDIHEKLGILLFQAVDLFQSVAFTSSNPSIAEDAAKPFVELEPIAKYIFVKDPPFGIKLPRQ